MRNGMQGTRRGFLKRAALVLGGALGAVFVTRRRSLYAAVTGPPNTPLVYRETSLKLYGIHWHRYSQHRKRGELPVMGDQTVSYGELLEGPDGVKVGEFYANCLHLRSPFGLGPLEAVNVEYHTFNLEHGTLLGMGTTRATLGEEGVLR